MAFAKILNDTIVAAGEILPVSDVVIGTGQVIADLRGADVAVQESCGWFVIQTAVKPPDTATTYFSSHFEVQAGRPIEVWDEFVKTPVMLQEEARNAVRTTAINDAQGAAFQRITQILNYNPPSFTQDITDATAIAATATFNNTSRDSALRALGTIVAKLATEMGRTQPAVQDDTRYIRYLAQLLLSPTLLDEG
jgi:hypothetical protein